MPKRINRPHLKFALLGDNNAYLAASEVLGDDEHTAFYLHTDRPGEIDLYHYLTLAFIYATLSDLAGKDESHFVCHILLLKKLNMERSVIGIRVHSYNFSLDYTRAFAATFAATFLF